MKKRNIGICIITTTLLMGGPAKATELILAKDHTNVVNQAAEIAAYKSNRPPVNKRLFKSKAVEAEIIRVKKLLTNQKLAWMFENCFPNTLETTVHYRTTDGKPDTFVYTGDIHAMWLRDSGAQVWPYIQLANKDPELKKMLEGVIRRQFKCINIDPYANAFNDGAVGGDWMSDLTDMKPELHERKWEIDSLCYPLRLAYQYWKETGDASIFDNEWIQAITNILTTFKEQQRKEGVGPYKFQRKTERALDTLNNNGLGAPVNPVGLIVSAFRPSDDATTLQFLVPSNFFAVSSLKKAAEILNVVNKNTSLAKQCTDLAQEVETALKEYATYNHPKYGTIYAFEVDGFGNHLLMDDANVPSLLAMPYLGDVDINDPIYQNTRRFVNPAKSLPRNSGSECAVGSYKCSRVSFMYRLPALPTLRVLPVSRGSAGNAEFPQSQTQRRPCGRALRRVRLRRRRESESVRHQTGARTRSDGIPPDARRSR